MSNPTWIKKYLQLKPEVKSIFDDLDEYKQFCVDYGYAFNEADLYSEKYSWNEFAKSRKGRAPKDQWASMIRQTKREQDA